MGIRIQRWLLFTAFAAVFFSTGCKVVAPSTPTIAPTSTALPADTITPSATPLPSNTPVPTITLTPFPSPEGCTNIQGTLLDEQITSKYLGEPLQYRIFLPPCYSDTPEKRYPVLYLLHGQQQDATLWEKLGVNSTAENLILSGVSLPFMIVMPTERHFLLDLQDTAFDKAIAEELIPAIDKKYPTCQESSCRAIGGISRGGAWAVRIGFSYPKLFHYIGAHSPAVFGSDLARLPTLLRGIQLKNIPFLYLDTGRLDDYRDSALQLESILTQFGVPHEWHLNEGSHNMDYWQEHMAAYILWYGQNWR